MKAYIATDIRYETIMNRVFYSSIALFFIIFITSLSASPSRASGPSYEWTKTMGGAKASSGESVAIDPAGVTYVTGYFSGTVDFDPGAGVDNHGSIANNDMFLTRINADGSYAWTKTTGGATYSCAYGTSVAVDSGGNIYIAGRYCRTVDFGPGADVDNHTSVGNSDVYLTRINADGSYGWTKTLDGTASGAGYGTSVAVDASDNIYLAGYFNSTVDFDPSASADMRTPSGGFDIFLVRINSDGSYGWAKTFGGTNNEYGLSLAADAAGNIFLSGAFAGTVDFDPSASADMRTSAGYDDIFLTRIDADGSYAWTRTIGGAGLDRAWSVAVDINGNAYLSGFFSGTIIFDAPSGADNHTATGQTDPFVTRINADGSYGWTKTVSNPSGLPGAQSCRAAVDGGGNIYLTGYFSGTVDFDPSTGIDSRTSAGPRSIFLTRIDSDGAYSWTRTMGSSDSWTSGFFPLAADADRNLYMTGHFSKTIDFDPSPGVDNHTSGEVYGDIFLTKFSQGRDELAVDFGSVYGLYAKYNNTTWTQLTGLSPSLLAAGDINGNGKKEVLAVMEGTGVWARADGEALVRLHPFDGELLASADHDGNGQDEVIVDFGAAYGIWAKFNNGIWTRLHGLSPVRMTTGDLNGDGEHEVVAEFTGLGLWARYNNTGSWSRIHWLAPELIATGDIDGDGKDEVIADFGDAYGVWTRSSTGLWTRIHQLSPVKLIIGDLDGNGQDDVIAEFPGAGIWTRYNLASRWMRLHAFYSDSITTGDLDGSGRSELIVDFGIFGIWGKFNNNLWTKLHAINPELMATGNLDGN